MRRARRRLDSHPRVDAIGAVREPGPEAGLQPLLGQHAPQLDIDDLHASRKARRAAARMRGRAQDERRLVQRHRAAQAAEADPAMQSRFADFPLAPGSMLRHADYLDFKDEVESLARERGYAEGRFAKERIDVWVDEGVADIELEFASGPRYAFGDVTFNTQTLSADVLHSFVPFEPGRPYDHELIAEMQRELVASDYFAAVHVRTSMEPRRDRRVPIRVDVMEGRAATWSVGGGYTTDYGPRLLLLHENRRRNAAGHQLRAEALLSPVRQSAALDYRVPHGRPQSDWWSLRATFDREDIDAGTGTSGRLGLRRSREGGDLTVTRFVDVVLERDRADGEELSNALLMPGSSWLLIRRDDLVRPREGYRLGVDLSAGVGSHVSLLSMTVQGKWIGTLAGDARVLVRGRAGAFVADRRIEHVPLLMRFFSGGDSGVRGYSYESLGSRDAEGDLVGGDRLLEASVEYERPLRHRWSAAAFVDAGNAFLGGESMDLHVGAGIGLRWLSPLGPVRLDVAWPLDGEDRSPRLHVSLGPDL